LILKKVLNNKYIPKKYLITNTEKETITLFASYQSLYESRFKEIHLPPPKFNFYV